jgi:hypothetical protein
MEIGWNDGLTLLGLVVTWSGFLIAIISKLLKRAVDGIDAHIQQLDNRYIQLQTDHDVVADGLGILQHEHSTLASGMQTLLRDHKAVEEDLQALRASLPVLYVRREDHIRNQSVIEAKLDALANTLELMARNRGLLKND